MAGRIYYFVSAILFLIGVFILLSPSLLTPDLIYPVRIDSTYIAFHAKDDDTIDSLLFTPADVGLKYSDVTVITNDNLKLRGWFAAAVDTPANTILILHDVNESKILYLDHMKQFHDRGFNVCVFDQRAHGNSEGIEFTVGLPAVEDAKHMIDTALGKKGTRHIALLGAGTGAAIALQTAVYDSRCKGLVLQSPFNSYEVFLERYAEKKWGMTKNIWYPVFKRRSEALLHYPLKELDMTEIAAYVTIPTIFVIASDDEYVFTSESLQVFDASATEKKELFLVRNAAHQNIAKTGGEIYYNRISEFILSTLPKEHKTTRYKKLALND